MGARPMRTTCPTAMFLCLFMCASLPMHTVAQTCLIGSELLNNPGFEQDGGWQYNTRNWDASTHPTSGRDGGCEQCGQNSYTVHGGSRMAVFLHSSSDNYIYQDIDVSPCAAEIDNSNVAIDATGWFHSEQAPDYDDINMQVRFYRSYDADRGAGEELSADRYDSGTQRPNEWTQYGVHGMTVPASTRSIQIRWNAWEDGWDSGSADDFSMILTSLEGTTGATCQSPLNDPGSYASEDAMRAAGWMFNFDVEAEHGYHAVYVRQAGPIQRVNSLDYCGQLGDDPDGDASLMSGWKWSSSEGELAAILQCGNCKSGVARVEFADCNDGHVQIRLNAEEFARANAHEIKEVSVPFRNGDRIGIHDSGGNAVIGLYAIHLECDEVLGVATGGADRADEGCDLDTIAQQISDVNTICCHDGACDNGGLVPDFCSCDCAEAWAPMFHRCEAALQTMASLAGGDSTVYEDFDDVCTQDPTGDQCCKALEVQIDVLETQLDESQELVQALQAQLRAAGIAPHAVVDGSCDESWTVIESRDGTSANCFKCFTDTKTWMEAEESCRALGGRLAEIPDQDTNRAVKALCPSSKPYIGGTDIELEDEWKWSDGSAIDPLLFHPGEPNMGSGENCMNMYFDGSFAWADVPCELNVWTSGYVCMIERAVGGSGGHR